MALRIRNANGIKWIGVIAVLIGIFAFKPLYSMVSDDSSASGNNLMDQLASGKILEPDYKAFPKGYTVDNKGEATNLAFHEISWQYFLWLTEEQSDGRLRFESVSNLKDDSVSQSQKFYPATIIKPGRLGQVDRASLILGGINQAGSHGILVDENSRAVYTSMVINGIYHDFVVDKRLYKAQGMEEIAPEVNFPNGSMSIKASWRIVEEGEDLSRYLYTRKAELYKLRNIDNRVVMDEKKVDNLEATVALVGLHIAVVVKDHPEFIWATYEFDGNVPNQFVLKTKGSEPSPTLERAPVPDRDYLFYKAGTPFDATNRLTTATSLEVDFKTQKLSLKSSKKTWVTQVSRRHQFGGGKESNQVNIQNLNQQVKDILSNDEPWKNSLWKNYHEVGAVWFNIDNGKLEPNWSPSSDPELQTGSTTLSNSTIETFTQDPNDSDGCFSCHNTTTVSLPGGDQLPGKNVLTSHILLVNYMKQKETDLKNIIKGVSRSK